MNQIANIAYTVKSQASALDIQSKKETEFLERYSRYIIKDDCTQFFTDSQFQMLHNLNPKKVTHQQLINHKTQNIHNPNIDCHVFFAVYSFSYACFSSFYNKVLEQYNVYNKEDFPQSTRTLAQQTKTQQRRQLFYTYRPSSFRESQIQANFYELYSNALATEQDTVDIGEIVIFDSRIKCSSLKCKQIASELKKLVDQLFEFSRHQHQIIESEYLDYLRQQKPQAITLILLYNGDVNFDFQKHLNINSLNMNNSVYKIKLKVYYVSKQALFSHFKETNKQKIDCISDQIVTFYDLNRVRHQRTNNLKEIDKMKKKTKDVSEQRVAIYKRVPWYILAAVIGVVSVCVMLKAYYFMKRFLKKQSIHAIKAN